MSQNQEEFKIIIDSEVDDTTADLEGLGGMFESLGGIVTGFAATAGAALLALAGIIAGKAVTASQDLDRAVANLGKKTGASAAEMEGFRDSIQEIYTQNWGESFQDIADSMAEVKTQTKLTGTALEETTKDAIILRDTFGYEVNESTRAAKQLMDQFGVSSKEAFNLIAQGAQKGLDKNGDLLDSINEYSVQFKALGFDSDQMFDTLVAGAEGGAFSIDKIGDAVKEFNIRAKDGSKTSMEAFDALGLNAEKMTKRFAKGGDDANKAFYEVIDALSAMKDPVAQNTTGVNLFGSMFEDLGVKGITALGEITDGFNRSKKTMEELDKMSFKGVDEYLETFGRLLEVNILIPLGDEIAPVLNTFLSWFGANLPKIIELLKKVAGFFKDTFGPVVMDTFNDAKKQISDFISGSGNLNTQLGPIIEAAKELFRSLATMWGQYGDMIVNTILPMILNYLKIWLPAIMIVIYGLIKGLTFMYDTWNKIFSFLAPIISFAAAYITAAVNNIVTIIRGVVAIISGIIHGDWAQVWAGAKMIIKGVLSNIALIIKTGLIVAKNIFISSLAVIVGVIKLYFSAAKAIIVGAVNVFKAVTSKAFSFMVNTIRSKGGNIKSIISELFNYIKTKLSGLAKSAYQWGVNFLASFGKGVKSKLKELKDAALSAAKTIKNVLGFSSPTKEGPGRFSDTWAPNFMDMFIEGVKSRQLALNNATKDMAGILEHSAAINVNPVAANGNMQNTINVNGAFFDQRMVELTMQRAVRMLKNRR